MKVWNGEGFAMVETLWMVTKLRIRSIHIQSNSLQYTT